MCGISKPGFTLVEILVAIAIIAVVATIVVPNLVQRSPSYDRQKFVRDLNTLSVFAWQQALVKHKTHKLHFDLARSTAHVEVETDEQDDKGDPLFGAIKGAYLTTSMSWPKHLEIKNFYVEGFDEMERFSGGTKELWFYIVPDGMAQAVIINMVDTHEKIRGKSRQIGLVLNPYSALFKEYDAFQK